MRKNFIYAITVLIGLMLTGCTLTGGDDVFESFNPDTMVSDPVKTPDDNDGGNSGSDTENDNTQNTENDNSGKENDGTEENKTLPDSYAIDREYTETAGLIDTITAYDKDKNVLWVYSTGEVKVGQYDTTTDVGERDDGYYYIANCNLYCIDKYTGEVKWKSEESVGTGCSFDFDEDGNIYVCGYEGPDLVVIDPNGKTLHSYGNFKDTEGILDQFYWAYNIEYENGKVYVTYENKCVRVEADPATGEAHVEEFGGNADWSESISSDWKMKDWTCSNGTDSSTKSDKFELEILDNYYMTLKYTDSKGNETDFDYMSIVYRPVDLYEGIKDDEYGVWCGECSKWGDKNNSFAYQMTDPHNLSLIWFIFDEDGNPGDYTIINFTK